MWNLPNVLTMARLAMVPVMIALYLSGDMQWALAVFCAASLTDCLDGYIARSRGLITNFGKLIDPLADKLMVISALICHAVRGVIPWAVIAVIALKDLILVFGSTVLLKRGIVVYSNLWGKSATVFMIAAIILGFFHQQLADTQLPIDTIFMWIAVGLSLCALISYISKAIPQLSHPSDRPAVPK